MRYLAKFTGALAVAVLAALDLSACTTLTGGGAQALRKLDFFADDIAALVFAVDVPVTLVPLAEASTITFAAVTPNDGERRIAASLVHADADTVAGLLPPPGRERAYYLFEFPPPAREALREAQQWARGLEPGFDAAGGTLTVTIEPAFCRVGDFDAAASLVSVLIVTAGSATLEPLLDRIPLAQLLPLAEVANLPRC